MKKQPLLILSLFALIFCSVVSCKEVCEKGSGKSASEERKVDAFTKINLSGAYKVILKQGSPSVKITADDNLLKLIETNVSGNELKISLKKSTCNAAQMEIYITNPNFEAIKSSGAVDVSSDGKLDIKDFNMDFSGESKVNLEMNAANVTISASGSSNIVLKGQATSNNITFSGSSTLEALDFAVAKYKIETNGVANCKINVLSELNVDVNGAGEVLYKGNPNKVDTEHSDASRIKKIQ